MNIHHLELFYYVARYGGIAAAVRAIPYGIQQPAVSGQMARLEESLGVTLFHRRPFALTPAGEALQAYIEPFFSGLDGVAAKIRGETRPQLRIAAPAVVLSDYLPGVLQRIRGSFPEFRLNIHETGRDETERLLEAGEIDLAIAVIDKKPRAGLHCRVLAELPLVLLVPCKSPMASAAEFWGLDKIEETLIAFPPSEPASILFQRGLAARGVEWFGGIEVNSMRLIEHYVASGFGIGLGIAVPGASASPEVRRIPLEDFPKLTVGVVWIGKLSPIARHFLDEAEVQARELG